MGASQSSTSKAGKFAGTPKRQRACSCYEGAATAPQIRRNLSNVNRNAKEFSRFWLGGGNLQPYTSSIRRRGENGVRRAHSARRPRSMSVDPTVRSPPRIVPSGGLLTTAAAHSQSSPTPPPSNYSSPRDSYRNEAVSSGPGLHREHSLKCPPPARCNGMQNAPTTPTTLYHRHPHYNYHNHRASLTSYYDGQLAYRTPVNVPRTPAYYDANGDYLPEGVRPPHLRQTSIY